MKILKNIVIFARHKQIIGKVERSRIFAV